MTRLARNSLVLTAAVLIAGITASSTLVSCSTPVPPTRSARLLTMAAEEAGSIDALEERLTRQLNIADLQIQAQQKGEALKTLRLAAETLKVEVKPSTDETEKTPPTFDDFKRIAGWTSVAELSRIAGDNAFATTAYINAVESLNSVPDVARRAQYVLSLSQICAEIKGKQEAAQLLVKGGEWAKSITTPATRRFALYTFANALITYDNFDDARVVMRNEPDARWRSDTFSAIARNAMNAEAGRLADAGYKRAAASPVLAARLSADSVRATGGVANAKENDASLTDFNKDLRYLNNYRQESIQQGIMPR